MKSVKKCEEDTISYGSWMGEAFSTVRRNTCTLRQHSVDKGSLDFRSNSVSLAKVVPNESMTKERFNNSFHGLRYIVAMLGGSSVGIMIMLRFSFSVAILNMVNQTALYFEENPDKTMEDFRAEGFTEGGEFNWDNEIQQMIMSLYMIAYTLPQLPCTSLALKLGARWAMSLSLAICAASNILIPTAAYMGWKWVVALRLINGIGASAIVPLMLNIVESWMPPEEVSLGIVCSQITQSFLITSNPLISGYLSSFHWSQVFYIPSYVTLAFCALWILVITDKPDDNWLVSQQEIEVICGCQNVIKAKNRSCSNYGQETVKQQPELSKNWLDVLRLPEFYAYLIIWVAYAGSLSSFIFIIPTYLRQFLKIDIVDNGLYNTLILSGCLLAVIWPHSAFKLLERRFNFSPTTSRCVIYYLVGLVSAGTWIYVGLFHQQQLLLLFLNRAFHGASEVVVITTIMSNFSKVGLSSIVFSMVNTVGNLSVVFAAPLIGHILDVESQSVACWGWILGALGLSQVLASIVYGTFIRFGPIEFKEKPQKSLGNNIESQDERGKQTLDRLDCITAVVVKDDRKGSFKDNFAKLRGQELSQKNDEKTT